MALLPARADGTSRSQPPEPADPDTENRLLEELGALEAELAAAAPPDDRLQALVRARLGGLYAMRHLRSPAAEAGDGDSDRDRALVLLRAARDGALPEAEQRRAARLLGAVLLGRFGGRLAPWKGGLAQLNGGIEIARRLAAGDAGMLADLAEARALLPEVAADKSDEDRATLETGLATFERMAQALRTGDLSALLDMAGTSSAPDPAAGLPQDLADIVRGMQGMLGRNVPFPDHLPGLADHAPGERPDTSGTAEDTPLHPLADPLTVLSFDMLRPGTVLPEELETLVRAVDAESEAGQYEGGWGSFGSALARMMHGLRAGDAGILDSVAPLLARTAAQDGDDGAAWAARMYVPSLLHMAAMTGGNLSDLEKAGQLLDRLLAPGSDAFDAPPEHTADAEVLLLYSRCMKLWARFDGALGDTGRLGELIGELNELREASDPTLEAFHQVLFMLFAAHLGLASRTGDRLALVRARAYLEEVLVLPSLPSHARPMMENGWLGLLLATAYLAPESEPDPAGLIEMIDRVRAGLDRPVFLPDYEVRTRQVLGSTLMFLYEQTGDHALRDAAVEDLELGRAAFSDRVTRYAMQGLLWELATARRSRGDRARGDQVAAVHAAGESLGLLAEDVLLQLGSDHGLQIARRGASRGLLAASWAASDGDLDRTVELLEMGRTLVLRAAAASSGVAEQLDEAGEHDLAEEWRLALTGPAGTGVPAPGFGLPFGPQAAFPDTAPDSPAIPSALRRRALEVLRRTPGDGRGTSDEGAPATSGAGQPLRRLLQPCGMDDLVPAIRGSGADALVYLVPAQEHEDGFVLMLPRAGAPRMWRPTGLTTSGRAPLERYLDTAAARSAADGATAEGTETAWQSALEALCDWAGPGVIGSVISMAADAGAAPMAPPAADPVRLVLVPCGNLGAVPWHAARLRNADASGAPEGHSRAQEPDGTTGRRPYTYACEHAVLTYAASGTEFVRAAARQRTSYGAQAVLVADPMEDLVFAEDEVDAVHHHYPDALVYGSISNPARAAGTGTPEDVLTHLPGGTGPTASLLHLAVHGRADPWAVSSAVDLAPSPGDAADRPGRLTVTQILDVRAVGSDPDPTGGLVVLSACETDLSTGDHDEALTPATAFLARGASDVVGTRWQVADVSSAPMMAVFHHHLAVTGLAPPDALRAAQLWMLDPDHRPVPGLSGDLLTLVERYGDLLGTVPAWAGFTHQGNPRRTTRNLPLSNRGSIS